MESGLVEVQDALDNLKNKLTIGQRICTIIMNNKHKEIIAYQGTYFTIEWFYDEHGNSEAFRYYRQLPKKRRRKVLHMFQIMAELGMIHDKTKFRHEGDQIYAFKPQPGRFLCFFMIGKKIIITNAFEKKSDKLPAQEKKKALIYRKSYEQRTTEGIYYESIGIERE